jgi:2-aminoethylphosphonate dioxygenase
MIRLDLGFNPAARNGPLFPRAIWTSEQWHNPARSFYGRREISAVGDSGYQQHIAERERKKAQSTADKRMPRNLTNELRESFRGSGFVLIPGFFSEEEVRMIRQHSDRMSAEALSILKTSKAEGVSLAQMAQRNPAELIVVGEREHPGQVCRYEGMLAWDSMFRQFVAESIGTLMTALAGEPMTPFKDKTNEKHPGGGAFGPHQDFAAYSHFKSRYHATAMLSIDPATVINGCVQFATNYRSIVEADPSAVCEVAGDKALLHFNSGGGNHGDLREEIAARFEWRSVETNPADLVVFDSFVPHRSEANRSENRRRAVFITYSPAKDGDLYATYYAEKRRNYDDPKFHVSTPTSFGGNKRD